jgi:hypothetical protein
MAVAANGDDFIWPEAPDFPHRPAYVRPHLLAIWRFAGTQDGSHAMTRFRVIFRVIYGSARSIAHRNALNSDIR